MWQLGGINSDFTFSDDPQGGPCAQHTARELANGDIQIWDNGFRITSTTPDADCAPTPPTPTVLASPGRLQGHGLPPGRAAR